MPKKSRPSRKPAAKSSPVARPVKVIKISKRLEKVAREIKDADDFVEHIAGVRNRYRKEHDLSAGDAQAALRQSTRAFHKHATALAAWLRHAHEGKANAIEREALDKIGTTLSGSAVLARPQSAQALDWLIKASQAAEENVQKMTRREGGETAALRLAAEGLRATFEHHKLKIALSGTSDAVRLLCAIAQDAGSEELEPLAAKIALRDSTRPAAP